MPAGFLMAGGQATYYYHALAYSPPHPVCKNSWGTYHMFTVDENYKIRQRTSQFFAAQMITQKWVQARNAEHRLFAASSDLLDKKGNVLVTAYPVLRPDGQWSLMVINRDYDSAHDVRLVFRDDSAQNESEFAGPLETVTFGKAQYQWHPRGETAMPIRTVRRYLRPSTRVLV